jgi:NAD(P)-dependent dehydrogenase (short-subunit alcohol dehydrogenase family)
VDELIGARTALVTGGSGGIGKACAAKLCELGYDVVLSARRVDPLRAAADEIGARYIAADASDPDGFAQAIGSLESIDLVVHAAGTLGGTYARKQTFEQWQTIMSANLDSCFVVTAAALPKMRPGSRLVFISSSAAHEPMMARTAYSASKAGMNAFARALALEVDRDGIAVHIVTPGPVETEMLQDVPFEMNALAAADVADAVAWLDTVDPSVDLPEIRLHAVRRGPFAREPVVPDEARRRAAQRQ